MQGSKDGSLLPCRGGKVPGSPWNRISISRQPGAQAKLPPSILSHFDVGITRGVFAVIYNIFDTLEILKKSPHCDTSPNTVANVRTYLILLHCLTTNVIDMYVFYKGKSCVRIFQSNRVTFLQNLSISPFVISDLFLN